MQQLQQFDFTLLCVDVHSPCGPYDTEQCVAVVFQRQRQPRQWRSTLSQSAQEYNCAACAVCVVADKAHDAICALHAVCVAKQNTAKRSQVYVSRATLLIYLDHREVVVGHGSTIGNQTRRAECYERVEFFVVVLVLNTHLYGRSERVRTHCQGYCAGAPLCNSISDRTLTLQ